MNENFKQMAIEWWYGHSRTIKAGVICGLAGAVYGFVKGAVLANKVMTRHEGIVRCIEHIPANDVVVVDF